MRVKKLLTFIENCAGILVASQHPMSGILLEQEKGLSSFQKSPSETQRSVTYLSRRYLQIGIR